MTEKTEVIVAGGGASGMAAAIACGRLHKKVLLLEHNGKLGRKLLATGNGKCNYTNKLQKAACYRGEDREKIQKVLGQFGVEDTLSFFRGLGIYPKEKNGYYYPHSEQASAVVEAMELALRHLGVEVKCGEHIMGIEKKKGEFLVSSASHLYKAKKVILATGGLAAPKLGSDGSGYGFARAFGHPVTDLCPGLLGLRTKEDFHSFAGVRITAKVTLIIEETTKSRAKETYEERGELQLTSYGISGIPVFQLSRYGAKGLLEGKKVSAVLDFLPDLEEEALFSLALEFRKETPYKTAAALFNGILDRKISMGILKRCGVEGDRPAEKLTKQCIREFCHCAKGFTCAIIDTNGFENAQVTAGGVKLSEVSAKTMESSLVKGLYFAGELLDVDGICGGYNLQWAWATGFLAGQAAGKG